MDIIINNQQEFNTVTNSITKCINNGETDINVILPKGTLYFNENHIRLNDIYSPDVSINFIGNDTKLTSYGTIIKNGDKLPSFNYSNTFLDITEKQKDSFWQSIIKFFKKLFGKKDNSHPSIWSELIPMDNLISVEDSSNKICCIRHKSIKAMSISDGYVQVTQWFKSGIYKIISIEDGAIYFKCNDLVYRDNKLEYSINNDFIYGNIYPRFRYTKYVSDTLCIPNFKTFWMCTNSCLLDINNCQFNKLSFKNITVEGNSNNTNSLLSFNHTSLQESSGLIIENCKFDKIQSHCIYINDCTNIVINNNVFTNIGKCCNFVTNCQNISIMNNLYKSVNTSFNNTFAIRCNGTNYYISNNTLKDFGYGGIGVGVWYASNKLQPCTGTIVGNSLTDTKTVLMDSGAIYLWTDNDDVLIQNNIISNYTGPKDNRGIFCDDGAKNFTIEGNHISNTPNSYSIDARRVVSIEEGVYPGSHVKLANINNKISGNYIDGPIRFEGRSNNSNCVLYDNYRNSVKEFNDILNYIDIKGKFNPY